MDKKAKAEAKRARRSQQNARGRANKPEEVQDADSKSSNTELASLGRIGLPTK
jgi:hypothetical protein